MTTREDIHDPNHLDALRAAPRYRKAVQITAVQVTENMSLETILADGTEETVRDNITPGMWVITNPGGEQYATDDETFRSRNEHVDGNTFNAVGYVRAVPNPTGEDVVIAASWGSDQFGGPDAKFALTCDADGTPTSDVFYLIGAAEFAETYRPVR